MEILRAGDINLARAKKIKKVQFQCTDCLCVWEAIYGEYEDSSNQHDGWSFYMNCPCCNRKTFSCKKVEW